MQLSKSEGFTLAELMIVVSIFGVLLLMSIPGFSRFNQTWKLHGETDKMATAMRTARSAAINRNINVIFQFDTNRHSYFYFEDDNGNGAKDSSEYQSATHILSPGISFSGHTLGGTAITFGPRGNSIQSGTITMENTLQKTRRISLFGGSGNTRTD